MGFAVAATRDVELEIARAEAECATAEAQLRLLQAGARPEEVRRAEAQADALQAELGVMDAELVAAEADRDRFESLLAADAGSRKQRDDAVARLEDTDDRRRPFPDLRDARGPAAGDVHRAGPAVS